VSILGIPCYFTPFSLAMIFWNSDHISLGGGSFVDSCSSKPLLPNELLFCALALSWENIPFCRLVSLSCTKGCHEHHHVIYTSYFQCLGLSVFALQLSTDLVCIDLNAKIFQFINPGLMCCRGAAHHFPDAIFIPLFDQVL